MVRIPAPVLAAAMVILTTPAPAAAVQAPDSTRAPDATRAPGSARAPDSARSADSARGASSAPETDSARAASPARTRDPARFADTVPATPDTFALPGIVVTATRVPLAREALPTPVTVWTGAELRDRGIRTVAEALERVPSATITRAGSPGAQTSLFLRGGESDYVKVLVDGVAVNDPGGGVDLADLSTSQVERIEVVRGPVSVLYGSDAVAGVVQVFTRRGSGAPTVTAQVMGGRGQERGGSGESGGESGESPSGPLASPPGTYDLVDAEATLTGATGALAYTVGGARSWSDGLYPTNNTRAQNTGTARLAWTPAAGAELAVNARYTDSRSRFPTDGTGALADENARLDRRMWVTSAVVGFRLHERVGARVRTGLTTRDQRSVDERDGPADTLGVFASELAWELTRRTVDARLDWELPRGPLPARTVASAGVAWERAQAATSYAARSEFGPTTAEANYRRSTRGYYLQLLAEPVDRVHLTLGGRLDDSDTYGAFETYRLGAVVEPAARTRLRVALGRGFREPSFDQVFGSGFGDVGNPGLEPERSRSREVGLEHEIGPATVVATWFDQRFERLIQYTFAPPSADDPNYFNVGTAAARGLELEGRATAGRLSVTSSYTYLDTEVLDPGLATDAGFVDGEPLLRRPTHAGTLTGRLALGGGSVAVTINAVGDREDLDFAGGFPAPRITLPGYATLDISAEHDLPLATPATRVLLQVENALDTEFQSIAGFPGIGRIIRLGVRVNLE